MENSITKSGPYHIGYIHINLSETEGWMLRENEEN